MPRLTAKYDQPIFRKHYPKRYLMDKNFDYPVEEMVRRHPEFARTFEQINKQTRQQLVYAQTPQQKQDIIQHSNQKVWQEVLKLLAQKR